MSIDLAAWAASLSVTVGGVDRTAHVVGRGEIDRELDASGLAEFRVARATGKPTIGAAVQIAGLTVAPYVGVVSGVQHDAGADTWVVSCTDGLQALFEGAASLAAAGAAAVPGVKAEQIVAAQVAAVLALLPAGAIWHRDLHGEWTNGWQGAQDALTTVCASIYIESGALYSVAWAGSGAATTLGHAAGDIYDQSVAIYEATERELIREISATVEVGYSREQHWTITVGWAFPDWDFCVWRLLPVPLPTRQAFADLVNANPWSLVESTTGLSGGGSDGLGIFTEGLPESGVQCSGNWNLLAGEYNGSPVVWTNELYGTPAEQIWHATCKMARRWSTSIVETYRLTVKGPAGTVGAVVEDDQRSHDAAQDDAGWNASAATRAPSGTGWQSSGPLTYRDRLDPADRAALLEGRLRTMAHRLRASQRRSTMSCRVAPGAEPALGSRVRMIAEFHDYTGQCTQLVTTWDGDTHDVGCTVVMSITAGSDEADDFSPPAAPTIAPTPEGTTLSGSVVMGTHIGGTSATDPEQDDAWDGLIANAPEGQWGETHYPVAGSQTYEPGFTLVTPEVPQAMLDDRLATVTHTIEIDPFESGI